MGSSPILGTFFTIIQLDFLVLYRYIFILLFVSSIYGNIDLGFDPKPVKIKGESLTASDVLAQVESQIGLQVELNSPDVFNFKKDYNDEVEVAQIIEAVIAYYREFNHVDLEVLKRARRKIILREVVEVMPEIESNLEIAKKRVERDLKPATPGEIVFLEEPIARGTKPENRRYEDHVAERSELQFEVTDLITLNPPTPIKEDRKVKPKSSKPTLEIELVGSNAGLIDFEDDILNKDIVSLPKVTSLSKRMNSGKANRSLMSSWRERETGEWVELPSVEIGYFGTANPWMKPSLLSYKANEGNKGELKVSFGLGSLNQGDINFNGIKLDTQKVGLAYQLSLSDVLVSKIETSLQRHDGEVSVSGARTNLDTTGLSDTTLSLNYIPIDLAPLGDLAFGLSVSLPTGRDSNFMGAGDTYLTLMSGYHLSVGRWRGALQFNYGQMSEFDDVNLKNKNSVFSSDFSIGYYFSEVYDLAVHANFTESPWSQSGIWGVDIFNIKTVLKTHTWTDPVSFYVDIGLSDATPALGVGLQWFREFL